MDPYDNTMPTDDSLITGNMPWDEGADEPYYKDPFAAGAAMVLVKGPELTSVVVADRERFRIAFYRAFAALSPYAFSELMKLRGPDPETGELPKFAPDTACGHIRPRV